MKNSSDVFIRHIAGEYDDASKIQLCVMCGCVLWTNNDIYYLEDNGPPPRGWEDGADIFSKGGCMTMAISDETERVNCTEVSNG
jgi:hypothetical protein